MAKLKVVAEIEPKGNFPVVSAPNVAVGNSTLDSVISGIDTDIGNKVDKVSGKGLSTNDYTTAEKNKLAGIADNANNYVHPTTSGNKHIPSGGSSGKILGWSADGTAAWVDPTGGGGGDVSSVKVGSTTYSPDSSGVVSLPAYPTSLPANGGTASNVSGIVAIANGGTGATSASSARSNLGLGSAATKSSTTSVTSGSSSLVTSGGVYTAITNKLGNLRSTVVLGGSSGVTKTIAIPSVDCYLYCLTGDGNISPTKTSLTSILFLGGTKAYGVHDSTLKGLTSNSTDTVATLRVGAYDAALLLWTADISLSIN